MKRYTVTVDSGETPEADPVWSIKNQASEWPPFRTALYSEIKAIIIRLKREGHEVEIHHADGQVVAA